MARDDKKLKSAKQKILAKDGKQRLGYDWDKFFDRDSPFTLTRGTDYTCAQTTMCQQIRQRASDRGLPISIKDMDTCLVVTVRCFFKDDNKSTRAKKISMAENAERLICVRTGLDEDAYSGYRTNSESMRFIRSHPRILDAVEHIYGEDRKGGISKYINAGTAAGLLFLMAASQSDGKAYRTAGRPTEDLLELDKEHSKKGGTSYSWWDKACQFWVLLNNAASPESKCLCSLRCPTEGDKRGQAYGAYIIGPAGKGAGAVAHRTAAIIKAWNEWSTSGAVTSKTCSPVWNIDYADDDTVSSFYMNETPTVGGIDKEVDVEQSAGDE